MSLTYKKICELLKDSGVPDPDFDAAELVSKFCGLSRGELLRNSTELACQELDSEELCEAVKKRAQRYPLQYIIGEWDFYRQRYKVNENCLIPRQDTEVLVEKLIACLPRGATFIDLCTGSGCIAVSTLAERADTRAYAVDIFEDTVALARENAYLNGVGDRFECETGDVLDPDFFCKYKKIKFDAVVSNPPYIASREVEHGLDRELSFEPQAALDGGKDGLVFYRAIVKSCASLLKDGGFMVFEIGYDQAGALRSIAADAGMDCEIFKDYGGNDRVAILR